VNNEPAKYIIIADSRLPIADLFQFGVHHVTRRLPRSGFVSKPRVVSTLGQHVIKSNRNAVAPIGRNPFRVIKRIQHEPRVEATLGSGM